MFHCLSHLTTIAWHIEWSLYLQFKFSPLHSDVSDFTFSFSLSFKLPLKRLHELRLFLLLKHEKREQNTSVTDESFCLPKRTDNGHSQLYLFVFSFSSHTSEMYTLPSSLSHLLALLTSIYKVK